MAKKKIVSIEERIPKLKQERKKKANRRLIFYLSIFFFLISIIVYLQSPLSHVKTIEVQGNSFASDKEVINQSNLSKDSNIWMVDEPQVVKSISDNPIIKSVEVNRELPWTIEIKITEYNRVGYIKKNGVFHPVLGNGNVLTEVKQKSGNGDVPLLMGFTEKKYLHKMASKLEKLPESILNLISEVHWKPTDDNKNKVLLYMNDGYIVDATIRGFAEKMKVYPSIVSQLKPNSKGIIHIGVGAYFEAYNTKSDSNDGG